MIRLQAPKTPLSRALAQETGRSTWSGRRGLLLALGLAGVLVFLHSFLSKGGEEVAKVTFAPPSVVGNGGDLSSVALRGANKAILTSPITRVARTYDVHVIKVGDSLGGNGGGRGFSLMSVSLDPKALPGSFDSKGEQINETYTKQPDGPDRAWIERIALPTYVGRFTLTGPIADFSDVQFNLAVKLHQGPTPEVRAGEGQQIESGSTVCSLPSIKQKDRDLHLSVRMNNSVSVLVTVRISLVSERNATME